MNKEQKIRELGFIPPSCPELEQAILGAVLLEASAFERVENILADEDFYHTRHGIIFKSAKSLYRQKKPIDIFAIMTELKSAGSLDEIGEMLYLSDLTNLVASSAHIEHHARIIKQKAIERQIINISHQTAKKVYEGEDIGDVMFWQGKEIEKQQERLIGKHVSNHVSVPIQKSLEQMSLRIELNKQGKHIGITTGLSDLDKITNGWQGSELIVIAARPAMGKTAFALQFAKAAAKTGHPVAMFSLEMSDVSLADRLLLSESGVNAYNFRSGRLSIEDSERIETAAGRLWELPLYIDDNASVSMSYIRSRSRLLKKQGKCDMVIIDYLQLAGEANEKSQYRESIVRQMSREAKIIAKELNVPVLLLSQLNRSNESRADKRPALSDLRESGAIEQDADMVCLIHRPDYYGQELKMNDSTVVENGVEFIIAKYRNGATGALILQHDGTLNRIFDYRKDGNASTPKDSKDLPF